MKISNAQEAIKQAIQGGYKLPWTIKKHISSMRHRGNKIVVLTDPLFWQALGKARGWIKNQWIVSSRQWFETRLSNADENKFWESLP
jgi:hypothetical protein